MTKKEIIDYVMETPQNTNPAILSQMLDEVAGEGGTDGWIKLVEIELLNNEFPETFDISDSYFYLYGSIHVENDIGTLLISGPVQAPEMGTTKIIIPVCTEENSYTTGSLYDSGGQLYISESSNITCSGNVAYENNNFIITGPGTISGIVWEWS